MKSAYVEYIEIPVYITFDYESAEPETGTPETIDLTGFDEEDVLAQIEEKVNEISDDQKVRECWKTVKYLKDNEVLKRK